jgi:recombination protein RecT
MSVPEKSVAALIQANFKAMKSVLPKHMTAERMARIALIETRKNPKMMQADPATLIGAIMVASQLGLEPGVQGMCYLVPYWNSSKETFDVQLQVGYKGMMELAWRSNRVGSIFPEVVRANDRFMYQLGTDPKIEHIPASGDRGPITHFYCTAKLVPSGHPQFKVLELSEVEKIRDQHSKAKTSDKGAGFAPWRDHFEAMGLKTAIRKNCKYLPSSPEFLTAIALDEMADAGIAQNLGAHLPSDMELPADFASEAVAEKTATTADKIKSDLEKAGAAGHQDEPPHPADEVEPTDPEKAPTVDQVPEAEQGDQYDLMEGAELDEVLKKANNQPHPNGIKQMIKAALVSDDLKAKRAIARRVGE